MYKYISLFIMGLLLSGCATTITKGKWVDGKKVPDEYIEVKGLGSGEFPGGYKASGEPLIKLPPLEYKKD